MGAAASSSRVRPHQQHHGRRQCRPANGFGRGSFSAKYIASVHPAAMGASVIGSIRCARNAGEDKSNSAAPTPTARLRVNLRAEQVRAQQGERAQHRNDIEGSIGTKHGRETPPSASAALADRWAPACHRRRGTISQRRKGPVALRPRHVRHPGLLDVQIAADPEGRLAEVAVRIGPAGRIAAIVDADPQARSHDQGHDDEDVQRSTHDYARCYHRRPHHWRPQEDCHETSHPASAAARARHGWIRATGGCAGAACCGGRPGQRQVARGERRSARHLPHCRPEGLRGVGHMRMPDAGGDRHAQHAAGAVEAAIRRHQP